MLKASHSSVGKIFVVGSTRERTEMDDILDTIVLENYYENHPGEKTPEKDKEIIENSYLMEKS